MKYVGSLFSKMAAYGVALLVAYSAASTQAQQQQGKAVVRAIRGSAQYTQSGDWMVLEVDKVLTPGAVIKTGANSQVDLFLDQNGPVVRVKEDTVVALDSLKFEDSAAGVVIETKLNLTAGRILGSVKAMAAASKYEVKIPTGTVGIRGTEYDISANGVINMKSGSVLTDLTLNGQRVTMVVNAGQTFAPAATAGGPPTLTTLTPEAVTYLNDNFVTINQITGPEVITPPPGGPAPVIIPPSEPAPKEPVEPPVSGTTGDTTGGKP
jgi:ribosomal protein L14